MLKYVAIDSSLANTGLASGEIDLDGNITVDEIRLVETKKTKSKQVRASSDTIQRCRHTYNEIRKFIDEKKAEVLFVETPSGSQNSSAMKSYGATCQLIGVLNPPPVEVTPNEVKVLSVGDKKASKEKMIKWASEKYPDLDWKYHAGKLQAKNEHMADAIAIVHAGTQTQEYQRIHTLLNK